MLMGRKYLPGDDRRTNEPFANPLTGDESKMNDCDIWQPEEQFKYVAECAKNKGLTTAQALSEAAEVDPGLTSRFKTGKMKNPSLIPVVRLFIAAGASLDTAFGLSPAQIDSESDAPTDEAIPEQSEIEPQEAPDCEELLSLRSENERLSAELEANRRLLEERGAELSQARVIIKQRSNLITALMIILAVLITALVGVTIYDRLNPHVGWFRDTMSYLQNMV